MQGNLFDDTAFFAAIGRAVSSWAEVEDGLYGLFHVALGADDTASGTMYFALSGFAKRLDVTGQLLRKRHHGAPELIYWKTLSTALTRLAEQRNRIAHSPVNANLMLDASGELYFGGLSVVASPLKVGLTGAKSHAHNLDELEQLYVAFSVGLQEVNEFADHLSGRRRNPERYLNSSLPEPLPSFLIR